MNETIRVPLDLPRELQGLGQGTPANRDGFQIQALELLLGESHDSFFVFFVIVMIVVLLWAILYRLSQQRSGLDLMLDLGTIKAHLGLIEVKLETLNLSLGKIDSTLSVHITQLREIHTHLATIDSRLLRRGFTTREEEWRIEDAKAEREDE